MTLYPASRSTRTASARTAGSSSATSRVSLPPVTGPLTWAATPSTAAGASTAGRLTMNVVPLPASFRTSTQPKCWWTMLWTVARPRPLPTPGFLVVKNGSKTCSTTSAGMPSPVSVTESRTKRPGRAGGWISRHDASSTTLPLSIVSRPPSGMASRALTHRLTITCSTCVRSAQMLRERPRRHHLELDVLADDARDHLHDVGDDRVEIERGWLQDLAPAEGQHLPSERRRPLGRRERALEVLTLRRAAGPSSRPPLPCSR